MSNHPQDPAGDPTVAGGAGASPPPPGSSPGPTPDGLDETRSADGEILDGEVVESDTDLGGADTGGADTGGADTGRASDGEGPLGGGGANPIDPDAPASGPVDSLDVEGLVLSLETVTAERNKWQDSAQRSQAEFENYKKQSQKRLDLDVERISGRIVESLLPVLDACDGAVLHGADAVAPIQTALLDALASQGLERLTPADEAFDPEAHDAVMHEEAATGGPDYPVVAEVLRAGYRWQGRVLRPAMVRVQG